MADFDLKALYAAMDEQRRSRALSWAAVTREINHFITDGHPVASSTITGVKTKAVAEGDGILQMLQWLRRTPESFVPGFPDADAIRFQLPGQTEGQILRWDAAALHAALNAKRQAAGLTWQDVANEVGGVSSGMLTYLAKGGRVGFPGVMRMTAWLGQPATIFTRLMPRRPLQAR
jgi:hypothetical protein